MSKFAWDISDIVFLDVEPQSEFTYEDYEDDEKEGQE